MRRDRDGGERVFTGLVERTGEARRIFRLGGGWRIDVACAAWDDGPLELGESVAVQGACLTVSEIGADGFMADMLDETMRRTSFGRLKPGSRVNLERALRVGDRMGGHIVTGHVDETGAVASLEPAGRDFRLTIACSKGFARQCVMKGSVAIDGVSLTVTGVADDAISVDVIPHTLEITSLGGLTVGSIVNLESDVIGKYVARYMGVRTGGLTEETLRRAGFCAC